MYDTINQVTDLPWLPWAMSALPVSVVLLTMMYGLVKSLVQDSSAVDAQERSD